jgi:hypothetical protein
LIIWNAVPNKQGAALGRVGRLACCATKNDERFQDRCKAMLPLLRLLGAMTPRFKIRVLRVPAPQKQSVDRLAE